MTPSSLESDSFQAGLVTVVVPCFNYGHYLSDALSSISRQSFEHWECIIVDDGSSDDTARVASSYCALNPRFRLIRQPNRGLSAARNAGLRDAKGEFIQLLDADDLLEADKLRVQSDLLQFDRRVDLVYGEVGFFRSHDPSELYAHFDGTDQDWMPRISGTGPGLLRHLLTNNIMVVSSPLFRRNLVGDFGYFDEQLNAHEDWEFWLRCALGGATFIYDSTAYTRALVRIHESSMSKDRLKMCETNVLIRNRIAPTIELRSLRVLNCDLAVKFCIEGFRIRLARNRSEALRELMKEFPLSHGIICLLSALFIRATRLLRRLSGWSKQKELTRV